MSRPHAKAPPEFFVSRRSLAEDEAWARKAAAVVVDLRCTVISQDDFTTGRRWDSQMRSGLRSDYVIAIMSQAYLASNNCLLEWGVARVLDNLIAIRIEDCPPPEGDERVLYVDVFGCGDDEAKRRIRQAIVKRLPTGRPFKRLSLTLVLAMLFFALTMSMLFFHHSSEFDAGAKTLPREHFTFALGHAVGTLGLDRDGSAETIFEVSLRQLGFPEHKRNALCDEFANAARDAARSEPDQAAGIRRTMEEKVLSVCQVALGPRLTSHVGMGSITAQLLLLLRDWDSYRPDAAQTEGARLLAQLQSLESTSGVPLETTKSLLPAAGMDWRDEQARGRLVRGLSAFRDRFEMDPLGNDSLTAPAGR